MKILIIEDERLLDQSLQLALQRRGFQVELAHDGETGAAYADTGVYDLLVLDVMMPGISGLRVCEEIRKTSTVPILFLTAKAQESDKLIGLTAGGDDYLVKPFSYAELIARVKALLRRYCVYQGKGQPGATYEDNMLSAQGITIALDHNQVWVRGEERDLTEIEYQILRLLMQRPQWIFSAQAIYESIWNEPYFPVSNGTVMVHIRKLRTKIEDDPQNPVFIKTVWGKGYRFGWEERYVPQ